MSLGPNGPHDLARDDGTFPTVAMGRHALPPAMLARAETPQCKADEVLGAGLVAIEPDVAGVPAREGSSFLVDPDFGASTLRPTMSGTGLIVAAGSLWREDRGGQAQVARADA